MLKLIADSGSTKTQWLLCGDCGRRIIATGGLNPVHMSDEQIAAVLENELVPEISAAEMGDIGKVAFYGAGVRDVWKERMQGVLKNSRKLSPMPIQTVSRRMPAMAVFRS